MATHISEPTDATSEPISNEMHQQKVLVRKAVSELIATHHPTVPPTPELYMQTHGVGSGELLKVKQKKEEGGIKYICTLVYIKQSELFARRNPRLLEMIRSTEAAGVLNKPSSAASRKKQQQG
ncbi:hypothetical protein BASA81_006936 [Batrachochytrium salamandrivorans]|nr:hypothetical protein BASA81_006936 [Batrachochytrium salamandrivorans]